MINDDSKVPEGHPLFPYLLREATAEEKERYEQLKRERTTQAEIAALSVAPFVLNRACPKCRCPGEPEPHLVKWQGNADPNAACYVLGAIGEHFDRQCRQCGYLWVESVPA